MSFIGLILSTTFPNLHLSHLITRAYPLKVLLTWRVRFCASLDEGHQIEVRYELIWLNILGEGSSLRKGSGKIGWLLKGATIYCFIHVIYL